MASYCIECSRRLPDAEATFTRCSSCLEVRAAEGQPVPSSRDAGGGIGGAVGGIAGAVVGRIIVTAVVVGIGAIVGVICYTDYGEKIREQNEAAQSGPSDVPGSRTGEINIFDLRTGDCISQPDSTAAEFEGISIVPCSSATATSRVSLLFTLSRVGAWPGDAYFENKAVARCPGDPGEFFTFFYPSRDSWEEGDRAITCLRSLR